MCTNNIYNYTGFIASIYNVCNLFLVMVPNLVKWIQLLNSTLNFKHYRIFSTNFEFIFIAKK